MTKWDDAFNRSDSGGLGALYTDDAVQVTVHGTFRGREAIAKNFAQHDFGQYQSNNYVRKGDWIVPVGNDVRVTGKWKCAFHDTDARINTSTATIRGSWSVRVTVGKSVGILPMKASVIEAK